MTLDAATIDLEGICQDGGDGEMVATPAHWHDEVLSHLRTIFGDHKQLYTLRKMDRTGRRLRVTLPAVVAETFSASLPNYLTHLFRALCNYDGKSVTVFGKQAKSYHEKYHFGNGMNVDLCTGPAIDNDVHVDYSTNTP